MNFTVPEITIPGLNDAPCGLNPKIEELNAIKNKAAATIDSLTSSTGGIADSIGTLGSSISSSVSEVAAKLNENLLGDLPTIGLKLQDEFHSAINSFGTGQPVAALTKLREIEKQFPDFDMQKALDAAGGILPAGAIPANATDLIKGDLSKMISNLEISLPKIQQLGGDISSGVTSFLGNAQTAVGSALSSITSGSGTTDGLTSLASEVQTAVSGAFGELSKLGGVFSAKDGPISGLVTSLGDTASSLAGNLTKGIAKIPAFDICTAVPNQQVVNGEVKELPIPPVKPTVNSEPPTPPTPAPTPATPVLVDKYSFPFWTESIKDSFLDVIAPLVDGKRPPISNRIPLDTGWPAVFSEAGKILDTANIGREKEVENMKNKSMEELKRINAMQESLNAATKYLNTCGRFYLHRVKNNLIDKLE